MKAIVVAPGEGRFIAVGSAGTGVTVKASGTETGDLCTVWEGRVPPFIPRETIHGFHNAGTDCSLRHDPGAG